MAIKLGGLTSQKAIDRDSLEYPTENGIFNVGIFNLQILQIFSDFFFVKNLNHRSFGKSFEPRATCGPLFIQHQFKPL